MNNRTNRILELLTQEKRLEVSLLSEKLGVSQVTVRKDLDALEARGIIKREHGFALLRSEDDINGRIAYHYEEKRKIAARAAELVRSGDTVMIESGSCCALLADQLANTKTDLTIITNSAFIADHTRQKTNVRMILLGGIYQPDSQVMVGPMVGQCAENFLVDLFFIGADGYVSRIGFTNRDQMRAQAVRDMAKQAGQVVVLTESDKFLKHGSVPLNMKDKVKTVITDKGIAAQTRIALEGEGMEVVAL